MPITEMVKKVYLQNELGGNEKITYVFSDPDGIRTGKSGYSFGLCQFDIENNWLTMECLRKADFSLKEIVSLVKQNTPIDPLNEKLSKSKFIVDEYDSAYISKSIVQCRDRLKASKIVCAEPKVLIHIIDYHNQFYLSKHGKMIQHLISLQRKINVEDILNFKLNHTVWGKKKPTDVIRRYTNIQDIVE